MPDYNDQTILEDNVRGFIAEALGIPPEKVIPANDGAPAPGGTYATVLRITMQGLGIDSEALIPDPDNPAQFIARATGIRLGLFSVQVYRGVTNDYASRILQYPATSVGQMALARIDLSWGRAYETALSDVVISAEFEPRTSVRFEIRYTVETLRTVSLIASAPDPVIVAGP